MIKEKFEIQNDILYLLILLFITEVFNFVVLNSNFFILIFIGSLGVVILEIWFVKIFFMYSKKKVSKYSDVLMKISLKRRLFGYFILPVIFYISLLFFLFFSRNEMLSQVVIAVSMLLMLVLFLNVKSSLNKFYRIEIYTRAIFDFLCITILYLLLNAYLRIGLSLLEYTILSTISSFVLFWFVLRLHDRVGFIEILTSLMSSLLISTVMALNWDRNVFVIPAVGSLIFYLVISIWSIRFSGKFKLVDYLAPVLYVIFAMTLIFTM